jgi:hypothetical protein
MSMFAFIYENCSLNSECSLLTSLKLICPHIPILVLICSGRIAAKCVVVLIALGDYSLPSYLGKLRTSVERSAFKLKNSAA